MQSPPQASLQADRRLHPRLPGGGEVTVVVPDGLGYAASVVDRSLRGLRLRLQTAEPLVGEVVVLAPDSWTVHWASVVWRTPPHLGLSIHRSLDMRSPGGGDSLEARRLWREHVRS